MKSWVVYDSRKTYLEDFDIAWLPPQASKYLTPHIQRARDGSQSVALEAGAYIGALPLTTGDTLYILPRIGQQAFSRMLAVTQRLDATFQREFDDFAKLASQEGDNVSWIQLLARPFIKQLRLIEKNSLGISRVAVVERLNSARGQILTVPTTMSLLRREDAPVHCRFRARTYDSVEHRVLGTTAARLINLKVLDADSSSTALRWADRFTKKPLHNDDLNDIGRALSAGHYTGSRSYYISALVMSQLILAEGGVSLDSSDSISAEALLTNIYNVFETYIRVLLRNALSPLGFVVEKWEHNVPTLFTDGTAELKPDVIISDVQGLRLLVDVKYKLDEKISSADYYQMVSYLHAFRVKKGLIVRPRAEGSEGPLVQRKMSNGNSIYELNIGLSEYKLAELGLVENIKRVLGSEPP